MHCIFHLAVVQYNVSELMQNCVVLYITWCHSSSLNAFSRMFQIIIYIYRLFAIVKTLFYRI